MAMPKEKKSPASPKKPVTQKPATKIKAALGKTIPERPASVIIPAASQQTENTSSTLPVTLVKPTSKRKKRKTLITALSAVVAAIGLFLIIYPFWPGIQYRLFPPQVERKDNLVNNSNSATTTGNNRLPLTHSKVPLGNKIFIPKIGVEMPIVEG